MERRGTRTAGAPASGPGGWWRWGPAGPASGGGGGTHSRSACAAERSRSRASPASAGRQRRHWQRRRRRVPPPRPCAVPNSRAQTPRHLESLSLQVGVLPVGVSDAGIHHSPGGARAPGRRPGQPRRRRRRAPGGGVRAASWVCALVPAPLGWSLRCVWGPCGGRRCLGLGRPPCQNADEMGRFACEAFWLVHAVPQRLAHARARDVRPPGAKLEVGCPLRPQPPRSAACPHLGSSPGPLVSRRSSQLELQSQRCVFCGTF